MWVEILKAVGKFILQNKKTIAAAAGGLVVGGTTMTILTSKKKDKVYKNLMKQHDVDTAERLTKQFQEKYDELIHRYGKTAKEQQKLREAIIRLCKEFGIEPNEVL